MKCNSCKEDINSKMKFAIAKNSCPVCGKKIFSEIEFFFRKSLVDILENNNVNYPEQVNSIVTDIVSLIDKQARSARENGELPTATPSDMEVDENEPESETVNDSQDDSQDDSPAARATQEEIDFMNENGVVLGDGSLDDSGSEAMEEIRKKANRLKKKVKKSSAPQPIRLRES
jgi:hypothetical protein